MTNDRLAGRIALVTGGASGQGAAHTRWLAQQGAIVHFGDINAAGGSDTETSLRASGLAVTFHRLDVSESVDWLAVRDAIDNEHGRLDILVNNAGMLDMLSFEDATEKTWQRTIDVNQKSVFLGIKTMLSLLRKSTCASVINTSSIFSLIGAPDYVGYHASKGAVTAITKSAAVTLGPEGIRVNSIHPGYIDTPMLRREFESLPEGAEEESLSLIPLRRFASADEIASVVTFLASDDAAYITGAEIVIDGGVLAT